MSMGPPRFKGAIYSNGFHWVTLRQLAGDEYWFVSSRASIGIPAGGKALITSRGGAATKGPLTAAAAVELMEEYMGSHSTVGGIAVFAPPKEESA